jgi:hypothetical protein
MTYYWASSEADVLSIIFGSQLVVALLMFAWLILDSTLGYKINSFGSYSSVVLYSPRFPPAQLTSFSMQFTLFALIALCSSVLAAPPVARSSPSLIGVGVG